MKTKCIHLNIKSALLILVSIIFKGVEHSETDRENLTTTTPANRYHALEINSTLTMLPQMNCPSESECSKLEYPCIECALTTNCIYGSDVNTTCYPAKSVKCTGSKEIKRTFNCRYCYQTELWEYDCEKKTHCKSVATPREYYRANCTVKNNVICLGNRRFLKRELCNWTSGYKWTTTLLLSITLGGFGADRFYLGHWQEGIGKLFSFGGLGVWTLIDVLLISLHYLGPADGSLYI